MTSKTRGRPPSPPKTPLGESIRAARLRPQTLSGPHLAETGHAPGLPTAISDD
jgi:hypothetical protein